MSDVVDSTRKLTQAEGIELLKNVRNEFSSFIEQISSAYCVDSTIQELMQMRRYSSQEMYNTLKEVGVFKTNDLSSLELIAPLSKYNTSGRWGLVSVNGQYLLAGRYVIPIRDIKGKVTALVGWYPDERKYVTTPTFGFARDAQFFNIECYSQNVNADVYLVEGIFDTLALRSLDLFALGNMGLGLSPVKREILKRFNHVFAIPDADKPGRSVLPFHSKDVKSKFKWNIDSNVTFVEIAIEGIKDTDDLIKYYDCKKDLTDLNDLSYVTKIKETY